MRADRHEARILAMQALCQLDVQGDAFQEQVAVFLADAAESQAHTQATISYAQQIFDRASRDRALTGAELQQQVPGWSLDRFTLVDRNVLRVALAELDLKVVPPKVVINEALEVAKVYSSADGARFINGVLDALWKQQGTAD